MHDRSPCAFQPQVDMLGIHGRSRFCFRVMLVSILRMFREWLHISHQHHRMHHRRRSLHAWYSWHASRVFFSGLRFRICRPFIFWSFLSIFFNFPGIFEGYLTGAFSMMRISHAFFLCIYFHFALLPEASCTLPVALPGGEGGLSVSAC